MPVSAKLITEKQLECHADELLETLGLTLLAKQLQLGSYRLDGVAVDRERRKIVVVELKTDAHIRALSQLLLYRSALKQTLAVENLASAYDVDALLITTFLDLEVVDVLSQLGIGDAVRVKVCVGDEAPYSLVNPFDAPKDQAWYQRSTKPPQGLIEEIKKWNLA